MRLFIIGLVFAAAAGGFARAAAPGEAALSFLSRLRNEEVAMEDLLKGTALSPHCGEPRRKAIHWHLGGLARRLRAQPHEVAVLEERRDGDYAAVLVSVHNEHDPLDVEVLALGLAETGEDWMPAPMPGSFDNVHVGFDDETESRVDALERWMGAERIRRLRALQNEALRAFRDRMAKAVPDALLEKASPRQYVEAFLAACRESNLYATMRLLGGFEDGFDEESRRLQQTVARGLQGLDERDHWRLLISPEVVRVIVPQDDGDELDAEVSLLVFDPFATEPVSLLRFVLLRTGNRWQIELPGSLRLADESRTEFQRAIWREESDDNAELGSRFEQFFEQQHKPRRSDDLAETGERIEQTLRTGTLGEFFQDMHRSEDLSDSERRSAYRRWLAEFWTSFHQDARSPADGELVEVIEDGEAAVLVFHLISTLHPESVHLLPLLMMREEAGWAIAPGVSTTGNYAALPKERQAGLERVMATYRSREDDLAKRAATGFLERFVAAVPQKGGTVEEEAAGALVQTYRDRLRKGDLLKAFECCALLDPREGAWEALKALSYEGRGAQVARVPDRELRVARDGHWAAVSLRVDAGSDSVPVYPMYLVVATEQGPRIVVDVSLRLATNKGREVLNTRVWRRIREQLDDGEAALVQGLFQGHVETSKSDLAQWEKSTR